MESMGETYPITDLCAALGVSRAGFYAWRGRRPCARQEADVALGEEIVAVFARSRRTYCCAFANVDAGRHGVAGRDTRRDGASAENCFQRWFSSTYTRAKRLSMSRLMAV